MSHSHSFTVSPGFAIQSNVNLLISDYQSSGISSTLTSVNIIGDCLEFVFESELSLVEHLELENLVKLRDNEVPLAPKQITVSPNVDFINSTAFVSVATVVFPGLNSLQSVSHVKVVGYMETGGTSYQIRLYDVLNHKTIAEGSFTNSSIDILTLDIVGDFSDTVSILELHCKVVGSTTNVNITSMIIYHN